MTMLIAAYQAAGCLDDSARLAENFRQKARTRPTTTLPYLLTDLSGKIMKAVIGVGGFLGIGESDIAVNFDQLKFVNEPMRTSSTATTTSTSAVRARLGRPRRRLHRLRPQRRRSIRTTLSSAQRRSS